LFCEVGILPEVPTVVEEDVTRTGTGAGCIAGGSVEHNLKSCFSKFVICCGVAQFYPNVIYKPVALFP